MTLPPAAQQQRDASAERDGCENPWPYGTRMWWLHRMAGEPGHVAVHCPDPACETGKTCQECDEEADAWIARLGGSVVDEPELDFAKYTAGVGAAMKRDLLLDREAL